MWAAVVVTKSRHVTSKETYSRIHLYQERSIYTSKETCKRDVCFAFSKWSAAAVTKSRHNERWGAGVETQKNIRGEIGGWGRVPFNEPYAPSLSTIYDGA